MNDGAHGPAVGHGDDAAGPAALQEQVTAHPGDLGARAAGAVGETTSSPLLRRWMTPAVMRECRRKNVVAHVCGHHLDTEGNHVRTALCDRTLCLDPSRLSDIPLVIGVAAGRDKVDAVRATLRGDYLSALVTDERTARSLLESV